jgi:hypothetical protein
MDRFRKTTIRLDSNFGGGLIRQSEFRTVTGANAIYRHGRPILFLYQLGLIISATRHAGST